MGKMALLLVLGLSITVGIIAATMNSSKRALGENVTGFDRYATGRNLAHTGVNMLLRKFDRKDSTLIYTIGTPKWGTYRTAINALSGVCSLTVHIPDTLQPQYVDVTSKAFFMDSVFDMKLRLSRAPLPFPTVNEAVGLRAPDVDFQIKGGASGKKAFIDGFDHDIYGNLKAQPDTNNKPGVGVLTPSDTTTVLADSANINGTTDVVVDTNMFDPNAYVDEFIAAANRVYPNGSTISSATWGSVTDPWIVYCQGDVKITGTVKGYGILVVNGSLDISGGFTFTGLILVYKDSKIAVDETGGSGKDANIIGGLLMASPVSGSTFQMVGSQNIVYSKDALDLAKFASQLQWYTVVWWYETDRLFN